MASIARSYEDLVPQVKSHPGARQGGNTSYDNTIEHLLSLRPEWQHQAACIGLTELFYPERGEANAGRLRTICAGCEVREQCLDYAISNGILAGWWGGYSETDRRKIRRARGFTRRRDAEG